MFGLSGKNKYCAREKYTPPNPRGKKAINRKQLLDFLTEKRNTAFKNHEEYRKLAPNSYGTGVELGEMETCNAIIEFIEKE